MRFKKVTAAILAAATLAGFTGCNFEDKKNIDAVIKVTDQYVEALSNFDSKGILELTNWDKDDKGYKEVEFYVGGGFITDTVLMDKAMECYSYIASTIEYSYEDGRITLEKDNATLKIQYKMVDWKTLFAGSYKGYDELMDALKSSKDTIIVKDTLKFEKVKGEWKLTKITNLSEAFGFINSLPNMGLDPQPTIPDPTSDPTGTTNSADLTKEAFESYQYLLETNKDSILEVEKHFGLKQSCGIFDIDGDGVPEMFFLSGVNDGTDVYSATLKIYYYNEYAGEAIPAIEIPYIIYEAASGGMYLMFATADNLIITTAGGEEADFKYTTTIYNFKWDKVETLRRDVITDFNAPEGQDVTIKYYKNDKQCDEDTYLNKLMVHVTNTNIVLAKNYTPAPDDPDNMLNSKKAYDMLSYEDAMAQLKG
ncbi:MAG: hypothetical protein IKT10_04315 [Clostridiales bacterium]|nr:hypothetical protein [Clostridiales bacterium]